MSERCHLGQTAYSHLFPGAVIHVRVTDPTELARVDIEFADGSTSRAELLVDDRTGGRALRTDSYTTTAGTDLPEATWAVTVALETVGSVSLRLGRRLNVRAR
jgi:hypothetical protein